MIGTEAEQTTPALTARCTLTWRHWHIQSAHLPVLPCRRSVRPALGAVLSWIAPPPPPPCPGVTCLLLSFALCLTHTHIYIVLQARESPDPFPPPTPDNPRKTRCWGKKRRRG